MARQRRPARPPARAPQNLGIRRPARVPGAAAAATCPVDPTTCSRPDACACSARPAVTRLPAIAYTDEDKIDGACCETHASGTGAVRALPLHRTLRTDRQRACGGPTPTGHRGQPRLGLVGALAPVPPRTALHVAHAPASTAGNIHSKPYVFDSQRRVLEKFVEAARPAAPCDVVPSALFDGAPDWRLLTDREPRVLTAVFGPPAAPDPRVAGSAPRSTRTVSSLDELARVARDAADEGSLLHMVCRGVDVDEETWAREAASLLALFPDSAIVGGPLLHKGRVIDGARIAGVGQVLDAVDAGRYAHDPGYFAQA